jgi:hypothetical protein
VDDRTLERNAGSDDVQEAAHCEPGNESDGSERHVHAILR